MIEVLGVPIKRSKGVYVVLVHDAVNYFQILQLSVSIKSSTNVHGYRRSRRGGESNEKTIIFKITRPYIGRAGHCNKIGRRAGTNRCTWSYLLSVYSYL